MPKQFEKTQEQIMSDYARGLRENAENWLRISDAILEDREMANFALRMAVDNHNAAQEAEGVFQSK